MLKKILIQIPIERRTYVKGFFIGKYWAEIDFEKSDQRRENYYDLNIYEAEVTITDIRKFDEGEFLEAKAIDKFTTNFPSPTHCIYNDRRFKIEIQHPKIDINDEILSDVVIEHEKTFGTVKGKIYGYILHYDFEGKEIEIEEEIILSPNNTIIQGTKTGKFEIDENKRRDQFYNSNATTYWGDWYDLPKKIKIEPPIGCFAQIISIVPNLIFGLLALAFLAAVGWKVAIILIIIFGLGYFLSFINKLPKGILFGISIIGKILTFIFSWFFRLFTMLFLLAILLAILKGFSDGGFNPKPRVKTTDDKEETTTIKKTDEINVNDSLISHFRKWKDYSGNKYQGYLTVSARDFSNSQLNRTSLSIIPQSEKDMNRVYKNLVTNDLDKLNRICAMFDSVRVKNNIPLGSRQFANIIVSCIQDIPYTLVLQDECNPYIYNDDFIKKYLNDGGSCLPDTKYGILSPVEFMARLKGDCDTRTILLFSILTKFNYDVMVLGSYSFKHSILAINIKGSGTFKMYNYKKYYVWETTMENMQIGQLPSEISDMNLWEINLMNNNN